MIQVGLIDDHQSILSGLTSLLQDEFRIIFSTTKPIESLTLIEKHHPDVLIVDIVFPNTSYIEFYMALINRFPNIRIISYSSLSNSLLTTSLQGLGVFDVINKSQPIEDLKRSIKRALQTPIPHSLEKKISYEVTKSEFEIISLLAKGKTTKSIANELSRSHKTIENHRRNLLLKLNVANVSELISKSYQLGLLK